MRPEGRGLAESWTFLGVNPHLGPRISGLCARVPGQRVVVSVLSKRGWAIVDPKANTHCNMGALPPTTSPPSPWPAPRGLTKTARFSLYANGPAPYARTDALWGTTSLELG